MNATGSRRRALLFVLLAVCCAVASGAIAARYRASGEIDYGPGTSVVVVQRPLAAGEKIGPRRSLRALALRQVPERFVPPDALVDPAEAVGSAPRSPVPPGSYLLRSHLRRAGRGAPELAPGVRAVDVRVSGAAGLAGSGRGRRVRVDVLAADEPGSTFNPRVRVLARRVPLLGLRPLRGRAVGASGGEHEATLGLRRGEAIAVIEAENYARELRLLPRGESG